MILISTIGAELAKASMTGGVAAAVFVTGQIIQRFVLEPIAEMRKLIAKIGYDLIFYRNCFSAPDMIDPEKLEKALTVYRENAASLRSLIAVIPFYQVLRLIFFLPSRMEVKSASSNLIGLSNLWAVRPTSEDFRIMEEQFQLVYSSLRIPQ